ncbi:choice-of-anchor L domain-containing protein [Aequorivita nionensis]|uniref:choice-of-anchor L domain-containing protein n=1 Tax=Aequorivita nionensis TaxID=1287690 RepID=UPI003965A81F
MKLVFFLLLVVFCIKFAPAQNIRVDATTYTPQQLVEDILIDSGCISNVQITATTSGNFPDGDKSFGYFSANGSTFPFEKGIVMSTGKLTHVPGPNTTLSDDDAPSWNGDQDLETALNISNTTNATIIEFDFVPNADNIRFRYLFASEEYQEGDPNTCIYSDAFAFLIKPIGGTYKNIALVPGTNTPVLVTTVHSGIPGSCPPINETYFEGWNGPNVPINFNGQTKILIAETPVTVNQAYHIKLVIADEANYRYDSAVFLEGGSFNIAANLGPDRSFITNNPLCENESYILDATPQGTTPLGYKWYKDGILITGETSAQLTVTTAGIYKVEIDYGNNCIATDEVLIQYSGPISVQNTELYQCEPLADGLATFNLFDAEENIINGDPLLRLYSFHKTFTDAQNNTDAIRNPERYTNNQPNQIIYARVVSDYGCIGIAEITLKTTTNTVSDFSLVNCSTAGTPGFASFNFSETTSELQILFGNNTEVTYHLSYDEAISQTNPLPDPFTNTQANTQTIYARISGDRGCLGTAKINLNIINTPEFEGEETYIYCLNTYPDTITIASGLLGTITDAAFSWSNGETTPTIEVNEPGTYTLTVTRSKTINNETYSCTNTRTFTVIASETAQITYQLTGNVGNATLTVVAEGVGDYIYALDNGPFQQSPIFENVSPGEHTLTVKDTNGCGATTILAYVIGFPNFFTPNNDGYHDYWQVAGQDRNNEQLARVEIFNRFGKILYALDLDSNGWDGTYNGKQMPSSDYWFKATFKNGMIYRGHFSLKR